VNDKPILLKIKDWVELNMYASPYLNFCIGTSLLIVSPAVLAFALPWERPLP